MTKINQEKFWIELQVEVHPSLGEVISNFLIEEGSPGVIQEIGPGLSRKRRETIRAYFSNHRAFGSKKKEIERYLSSISKSHPVNLRSRIIKEEKWAEAWKSNFKALRISSRIVVKPPWETYPISKGQIIIEIDPGMAFGTGTHPSTQMCLQALDALIPSFPNRPSFLDVGTGSGILAIAAWKLGAKPVRAVDLDPVAVESARKNAKANNAKGVNFRVGSLDGQRQNFDITAANLLPQELLRLASPLSRKVSPGGVLIVSGFLRRQGQEIAEAFRRYKLQVRLAKKDGGWACFVLEPKRGER
jgi:ribosomal protein L11 methyltransferase